VSVSLTQSEEHALARRASSPLNGLTVLDFGHTVMAPSCGLVLADMGADVVRVEPAAGDPTRNLQGFGAGYFGFFNRNKRSIAIDLKSDGGRAVGQRLVAKADILIENFAPGAMRRLGLDYDTAAALNPRLIYASLKGFLKGPYDQRLALDEVVQMMSGLAYMTGPSGHPLRAGSSVVDIAGGLFAVIAILGALRERDRTGKGTLVESALYESAVFLMGQHLAYAAQSDRPIPPMPERVSAWAVYDLFVVSGGRQLFIGITSDAHWERFCTVAHRTDLLSDTTLTSNNQRIAARDRLMPMLREFFMRLTLEEAIALVEEARIPFSPIARPEDLFDDPHLLATGGLIPTRLPNGVETRLPRLPIRIGAESFGLRCDPPVQGAHSTAILRSVGYTDSEIDALIRAGIVVTAQNASGKIADAGKS
jgi:crotonobetainyl-CoA:carnitine CoA-transferase CaiB-like acyl-CoA transferase